MTGTLILVLTSSRNGRGSCFLSLVAMTGSLDTSTDLYWQYLVLWIVILLSTGNDRKGLWILLLIFSVNDRDSRYKYVPLVAISRTLIDSTDL